MIFVNLIIMIKLNKQILMALELFLSLCDGFIDFFFLINETQHALTKKCRAQIVKVTQRDD